MHNPFIFLSNKINTELAKYRIGTSTECLVSVAVQIKLLAVVYRSMYEFNIKISNEIYADSNYRYTKAVLDYFQFITLLNQLGRILIKHKCISNIPKFNRIRFFRNKVSEHWETYAPYGVTGGFLHQLGNVAIPSTYLVLPSDERKNIKVEIDEILRKYKLTLEIDDAHVANVMDMNVEKFYSTLEKIDSSLGGKVREDGKTVYLIPDTLVTLLFKFGFPAPIDDVPKYSEELVDFLETELLLI